MKLSNETINILKNFASINTNLLIREGSELRTIGTSKGIFAKAKIAETFPKEFAIYDLNSLLSLLTLMDDQDIEFGEKSLTVSKDEGTFEYFYSSPTIVVSAPTKEIEFNSFFEFNLTQSDLAMLMKAIAIVGAETLTMVSDGKKARLIAGDRKNSSSNSYSKNIGECDDAFECIIPVSNFIVMADNYKATIADKKLIHLKGETKGVEYFIATDPSSKM